VRGGKAGKVRNFIYRPSKHGISFARDENGTAVWNVGQLVDKKAFEKEILTHFRDLVNPDTQAALSTTNHRHLAEKDKQGLRNHYEKIQGPIRECLAESQAISEHEIAQEPKPEAQEKPKTTPFAHKKFPRSKRLRSKPSI